MTLKEVIQYVFHEFGVEYEKEAMRDLLKRLGFRYKKTRIIPAKTDPAVQQAWVEKFEDELTQLPDNVEVYFAEGVHPMHNTKPKYDWIKKRKDYETINHSLLNRNFWYCVWQLEKLNKKHTSRLINRSNEK